MSRKRFNGFKASVADRAVHLSAYKASPAFENSQKEPDLFDAIRVYRKEEPAFVFGEDYAEFFDGLTWRGAELVFEGRLSAAGNRKVGYTDTTVSLGSTYAYWLAVADGEPVGPVAVKVRDPEVWWSQARIKAEIDSLRTQFPDVVKVESIGRTVRGAEILALTVGKWPPRVGLVGAVHAGESGAELMLPTIATLLDQRYELVSQVGIAAVPVLNVDERERLVRGVPWYLRTNANGVDLNRNFPVDWDVVSESYGLNSADPDSATYRGSAPGSEPETAALMGFLGKFSLDAVFSFHFLASICGLPLLAPQCAQQDQAFVRRCRNLCLYYAEGLGMGTPSDAERTLSFGTTPGSLATWCYRELGVPAFDLELWRCFDPEASDQARVDKTDLPLLQQYRKRHTHGLMAVLESLTEKKN